MGVGCGALHRGMVGLLGVQALKKVDSLSQKSSTLNSSSVRGGTSQKILFFFFLIFVSSNAMTVPNLRESLGCLPAIDRGRHHCRDEEGKASQWVIHKTTLDPTRIGVSPAWENSFNIAPLNRANIFQSDKTLKQRHLFKVSA